MLVRTREKRNHLGGGLIAFFIYLLPCSLEVSPDLSESVIEPALTLSAVDVTANCVAWPESKYSLMTKWD